MGVEFGLLGEVTVRVDGRPVDLGPAKQRCVLAALAVDAPRLIPLDRLVERVWGADTPRRGRKTLYSHISRLRQALSGIDAVEVVSRAGGYALAVDRPDGVVDLHRFHDLRSRALAEGGRQAVALLEEALGLWRGEALAGLGGDWAAAERDRLHRERLETESDLVDARLALGEGVALVTELAARAAEHPLDERMAGQYLLALHRAGRTADALAHYHHVREHLADELGIDPGAALRELYQLILADDPSLAGDPAAAPQPLCGAPADRGSAVVPRQLPGAPAPFVGRHEELDVLDAALLDHPWTTTVVISAIAGAGGIGKTWLALHWAHRHAERFPDGQLFVDLRGFSPDGTPMDPAVAVRGFLDALGVEPHRLPVDPHAQAALYRSLVKGRRMLVVLDNAATSDQVVPLLPGGADCTVVVTSRHRLPGLVARHGARPLSLDVLTDAEAHAVLVSVLGAARVADQRRAVTELIEMCGGFPLALGVIAARARAEPRLPLDQVVAELRASGLEALADNDPSASLPAVLSWSLSHLTQDQRTVFALLGIAPGPDIGLAAVAALTDRSQAEALRAVRALQDASLVDRDVRGRYAMHDLVRACATATAHDLAEPVRRAALRRVVDFYLHTAHAATRVLDPRRTPVQVDPPAPGARPCPPAGESAAMAWLDAEHLQILAAQRTAADHHWYAVVCRLAGVLSTFNDRRGHLHDDLAAWQAAVDATARLPDLAIRSLSHRRLGRAHSRLGRHEAATGHLRQALALAERGDDRTEQALIHQTLALVWERRGDDHRALEHARRALTLHRVLGDPVREAIALNAVGWYTARCGDHDTAREHCQAALVQHRAQQDLNGEAATLDSLGWIDHRTGRHRQAIDHYEQALTLYRALGDTYEAAGTLDRLGHPHTALGRTDQARTTWQEALRLYRQMGRDTDAERVRRQLGALDESLEPADTRR